MDYEEGSSHAHRGRVSLACSGRQLPARWPSVSSSLPSCGLSSFSSSRPQPVSAPPVPLRSRAARRGRPGRDSPREPEAAAVNGIPGDERTAALTAWPLAEGRRQQRPLLPRLHPGRSPSFRRGFRGRTPLLPRAAANCTRVKGDSRTHRRASLPPSRQGWGAACGCGTGFRGGAAAGGSRRGRAGPGEGAGGAPATRGGARWPRLEGARLRPLFPSVGSRGPARRCAAPARLASDGPGEIGRAHLNSSHVF